MAGLAFRLELYLLSFLFLRSPTKYVDLDARSCGVQGGRGRGVRKRLLGSIARQ